MTGKRWKIVLGREAENDLSRIAAWTIENFGPREAENYVDAILDTVDELASDPQSPRSKARAEIDADLRTLHMARSGRRGRHFVLYKVEGGAVVLILRILHDSMELSRHVPKE
jgi:toxin ParE1/3/4